MKKMVTKYFLQRWIGHTILGRAGVNYLRLYKTILSFKLEYGYEYSKFLIKVLNKGDFIFDIGANIGKQACRFSDLVGPEGRVFCFEPVKVSFRFLSKMQQILGLKNIEIYNLAIGDHSRVESVYIPILKNGNIELGSRASIDYSAIDFENVDYRKEIVDLKTIDQLMVDLKLNRLDFIKCDTEGSELEVLAGGWETIKTYKPILQLELDYRDIGLNEWYNIGYSPYYIKNNELVDAKDVLKPRGNVLLLP